MTKFIKTGALVLSLPLIFGLVIANYSATSEKAHATTVSLATNPNLFVDLAQMVIPSVVNISVEGIATAQTGQADLYRKFFEEYYGLPQGRNFRFKSQSAPARQALGSGVVIDVNKNKLIILTNHHVIDNAAKITVQFSKGSQIKAPLSAKVIGKDPALDIAILEVETDSKTDIKALKLGNSETLKVGEYVMAVGNPFGQGHSVSHGIISAKERTAPILGKYLQTDAPINPGNSGGPLVNLKGEIIGINNAILAHAQGIGYAIPSNTIQSVLPQLKSQGFVERGYLGILMGQVSSAAAAFAGGRVVAGQPYIAQLEKGSPARKAGLKPNDVILKFNDQEVKSPNDLRVAVGSLKAKSKGYIEVLRNGKIKKIKVRLGKRKT